MKPQTYHSSLPILLISVLLGLLPASCSPGNSQKGEGPEPDVEDTRQIGADTEVTSGCRQLRESKRLSEYRPGYPSTQSDGNPYLEGVATLSETQPTRIELEDTPTRVIGLSGGDRPIWALVLRNGQTRAFSRVGDTICPLETRPANMPEAGSPVVTLEGETVEFKPASQADAGTYSSAVALSEGQTAYVTEQGQLRVGDSKALEVNALVDGHLRIDDNDQVLALTDPSQRYTHGILGDETEPTGIAVVSTEDEPIVEHQIDIKKPDVIEGIGAIWEDVDGDGRRDILVTTSNEQDGARLTIFEEDGNLLAESDPIGKGLRWRHQLAIAPFGPDGGREIVDVRTPHIGGLIEFFALDGAKLVKTAELEGFSSHTIGSRMVNQAVAADLDSDDHVELLVPARSRDTLIAVQRTSEGALKEWKLKLGSRLSANLAAARTKTGRIQVAAGIEGGNLLIW